MTILTDSTDHLPSLRERYRVPDCSWWCTGYILFFVVYFLLGVCLAFFLPWILILFYFIGAVICIICCFYRFTISPEKIREKQPLIFPKDKKHESKNLLEKVLIAECSNSDSVTDEKCRNSETDFISSQTDEFCGSGYPATLKANVEENIVDVNNKEVVTCVEFNSNRSDVCHEQYATMPANGGGNKHKKKNKKKSQGAGNFLKNVFRRSSTSEAPDESQPSQAEIPASGEAHQGTSKERTFPNTEQPVSQLSVTAEPPLRQNIRMNIPDNGGTQVEQTAAINFPHRTYENILPSHVQKPKSEKASDPNSGIQHDNPSNVERSLDTIGPYQNLPLQEEEMRRITGVHSPSKTASSPMEKLSFSPEMSSGNVTQDPHNTYRCYENLNVLRSGLYAAIRPQGVSFNIPATWQQKSPSKQAAGTSVFEYPGPSKVDRNSAATDGKAIILPTEQPVTSIKSAGQLARHEDREIRYQSKDNFSKSDVSSDYMDMSASRMKPKQYQQFQDAAEGFDCSSSSKTDIYLSVPEKRISSEKYSNKMQTANVCRTVTDKTSNIEPSGAVLTPKDSDRPYSNILGISENIRHQTSAFTTSTNNHRSVSFGAKPKFEEKASSVKSHDASNIWPVQGLHQTDHDIGKVSQSDGRESTTLVPGRTYFNIRPVPEQRMEQTQRHKTEAELGHKFSKSEICSGITDAKVSPRKTDGRKGIPSGHVPHPTDKDISQSHSRHSNPLYCERPVNIPPLYDPKKMVSNIHDPAAVTEKYSVMTKPFSDTKKTAEGAASAQRFLPLSEDRRTISPEKHLNVSSVNPEYKERLPPREQFQSQATRFSNESYFRLSELERKRSEATFCQTMQDTTENSESEWSADTGTDDSSVYEESNVEAENEEDKFEMRRKGASTSVSDYTRPPRRTFIKPDLDNYTRQPASSSCKLRPTGSKRSEPAVSKVDLFERETDLSASGDHSVEKRNLGKFAAKGTITQSEIQPEQIHIRVESPVERIYPKPHVSVVPSKRPNICYALPVKLPEPNPSTSEEYTDDTETDSPISEKCYKTKQTEGNTETGRRNRQRTRSEYIRVTEIGRPRRSYVRRHSSDGQGTKPLQVDSTNAARGYGNPEYGNVLPTLQKKFSEKERTAEGNYQTRRKDGVLRRSQSSTFCAVGSPKSPSHSQDLGSEIEFTKNSTPVITGDTAQCEKQLTCKEKNVAGPHTLENERSLMERRARSFSTSSISQIAANTPVITEGKPESRESLTISARQKWTDPIAAPVPQESCSPKDTGTFKIKESSSTPRTSAVTKSAVFPERGYVKSEGSSRIESAEKFPSYSENKSPTVSHYVAGLGRIKIPVPSSIGNLTVNVYPVSRPSSPPPPYPPPPPPPPTRSSPKMSLSMLSLQNTPETAGSIFKTELSPKKQKSVRFSLPDERPPTYSNPLSGPKSVSTASLHSPHSSPSNTKEPIQAQQRNLAAGMLSNRGLQLTQPRFAAPSERINLPVIENRSTILSLRLRNPSTANRSVPPQRLRPLSPLRSLPLCSTGVVTEAMPSPKSETNLPHMLSSESPTSSPEPVISPRPSSTRSLVSPSLQRSSEATGGPLQATSSPKRRKSRTVTLPETPLTRLGSRQQSPEQPP